jgi:hypothetical protein
MKPMEPMEPMKPMNRSIVMAVIPHQYQPAEPVILGQFHFADPLQPGASELDPCWFQPYPSQD